MVNSGLESSPANPRPQLPWFRRISTRLALLTLLIAVPLLLGNAALIGISATRIVEEQANTELREENRLVENTLVTWLTMHGNAVNALAAQPAIQSMDAAQQKPILEALAKAYPDLYLVQTTDTNGFNVARNDREQPKDYRDRAWFQGAKAGLPLTYDVVIGRTIGKPALNIAAPIRNPNGILVGVVDMATTLDAISNTVAAVATGTNGYTFVINEKNLVVVHPNPAYTTGEQLIDFSQYPPVIALRNGISGITNFTDENGTLWRAYIKKLDNGWGIITQEPEAELLAAMNEVQTITISSVITGALLLLMLLGLAIYRTLRPINNLIETAQAISAGDIERQANVESENEIGLLASAFNEMTARLRDSISNLETRVTERTGELVQGAQELTQRSQELEKLNTATERRAAQLQAISNVSRAIASVQEVENLLPKITNVISHSFGFYHVGIFLVDNPKEYAVLKAANSEGGQRMLSRSHQLKIGESGIVGYVAGTGNPRIALDTDADAVFFNNPDLPDTRSEMAIPLKTGDEIIGVLDVQSTAQHAFDTDDIQTMSILADQVSIALTNARSFEEARRTTAETQLLLQQYARDQWSKFILAQNKLGYRYKGTVEDLKQPVNLRVDSQTMEFPIIVRGHLIGTMNVRIPEHKTFSADEIDIIRAATERAAIAAENTRLLQDSQRRALKEQTIGEISAKISASINLENVFRTTMEELGALLPNTEIIVEFEDENPQ